MTRKTTQVQKKLGLRKNPLKSFRMRARNVFKFFEIN